MLITIISLCLFMYYSTIHFYLLLNSLFRSSKMPWLNHIIKSGT